MANKPLTVKCPTCDKTVVWVADNTFKPFCCEQCKLIDLGEWFTEAHAIPGEPLVSYPDEQDPIV
jgi:uncharacterized protein